MKVALSKVRKLFGASACDEKTVTNKQLLEKLTALESKLTNVLYETDNLYQAQFLQDPWLANAKNIHKGERCFLVATGPSLNKVDLSKIKNELTIGVNGIYKLPDLNLTYFCYVSNWYLKHHLEGLRNVNCKRRFIPRMFPELASGVPTSWLNVHRSRYYTLSREPLPVPAGFSFEPDRYIFAGGTVLFLCLQLAYYFGCSEVVLLGVDHSYGAQDEAAKQHGGTVIKLDGKDTAHFDSNYVPDNISYHIDLSAMEHGYRIAREVYAADGRRILNASPGTALETFPIVDYDSLF